MQRSATKRQHQIMLWLAFAVYPRTNSNMQGR